MKTFKTLILVAIAIVFAEPAYANNFCFSKEKDAWQILIKVLDSYQVDTAGLHVTEDMVFLLWKSDKLDSWDDIAADLAKAYRVRKPVNVEPSTTLGEIVCIYMEAKYARKKGEKYDYLKICYSPRIQDEYPLFKAKYPNSIHNKELGLKSACVKQNMLWFLCDDDSDRNRVYKQFGESYCPYNGFRSLSDQNNRYRKAVEDWNALMQERDENPDFDCDLYASFALDHMGSLPGFNWAVNDSLNACRQRQDWHIACEVNTIDAYRIYVMDHPESKEAKRAVELIEDMTAWQQAVEINTHASYSKYYNDFPQGDRAWMAAQKLQQMEEGAWQEACRRNTIESYEQFVAQYPQGYYAESATSRQIELFVKKFHNKGKGQIDKLELIGCSSRPGYGLICFGNVGKNNNIMVLLQGQTPVKTTIKPGQSQWVWVKNGEYHIYVTSNNGAAWEENGHGTVLVEDGLYFNSWYAWTSYFDYPDEMREALYTDRVARDRIAKEVLQRTFSEMERLEGSEISVQKRVLKNYYRQCLEKENDKNEYEKICWDLEDDANVGLLIRTMLCRESWF